MIRRQWSCAVCLVTVSFLLMVPATSTSQRVPGIASAPQVPHLSGQSIAPVFEGWEPNPDGTKSLWFGYMNRNYEEEPDIPIGPNNSMQPEPGDRGQPTHFLTRRHQNVFRVIVPKDFGDKKIVWTLSIRGKTESVPGWLHPAYETDASRDRTTGDTPPAVKAGPDQIITLPATAMLTVEVTVDGLPKREKPAVVAVGWRMYRGPGKVSFAPATQNVERGKAATTATFSAPGVYVIQGVVEERGGFSQTNVETKVTVNPAQGQTNR